MRPACDEDERMRAAAADLDARPRQDDARAVRAVRDEARSCLLPGDRECHCHLLPVALMPLRNHGHPKRVVVVEEPVLEQQPSGFKHLRHLRIRPCAARRDPYVDRRILPAAIRARARRVVTRRLVTNAEAASQIAMRRRVLQEPGHRRRKPVFVFPEPELRGEGRSQCLVVRPRARGRNRQLERLGEIMRAPRTPQLAFRGVGRAVREHVDEENREEERQRDAVDGVARRMM